MAVTAKQILFPVSAASTQPSWAPGIASGRWAPISNNTLSDVDPDEAGVNPNFPGTSPWNGATGQAAVAGTWGAFFAARNVGTHGKLGAYNGGHGDYYGTEVYLFDLASALWARVTDPFGSTTYPGSVSFPISGGLWGDGPGGISPSVPHTYYHSCYHPTLRAFIIAKLQTNNTPASITRTCLLNLDDLQWRAAAQSATNLCGSSGGWSEYDETRDRLWMRGLASTFGYYQFGGATGTSGTYSSFGDTDASTGGLTSAIDPTNEIVVQMRTNSPGTPSMIGYDLTDSSQPSKTNLTHTGFPAASSREHGMCFSVLRQSFLCWFNSGSAVYELKKRSGDWRTATWAWQNLTSAGNTVTPNSAPGSGCQKRLHTFQFGTREYALMCNGITQSVFAFNVPTLAEVPAP